jgi:Flp pilus assembly protein TadB
LGKPLRDRTFRSKFTIMKKSTGYLLAFAAGTAAVGLAGFWLASSKGKDARSKLKMKGEQMIAEAEDVLLEAKERMDRIKSELFKKEKRNERMPENLMM